MQGTIKNTFFDKSTSTDLITLSGTDLFHKKLAEFDFETIQA